MMHQLLEFAGNHLILVGTLIAILALLIHSLASEMGGKGVVGPQQATELINREDGVVLDVRSMADFNKGHIIRAINIPISGLQNQLGQLEKYKKKPIIVACRSGAQSSLACKQLQRNGFERVYNLKGGILGWQSKNLPMSRKK